LDLSGSYPTSLSGNTYIVSFIDLYSGWPEAFAVPDKSADQICNLLIDEEKLDKIQTNPTQF
jgi:hypothetical protein